MQVLRITRGKIRPGTWDQFEAALHSAHEKVGHIPGMVSRSLVRNVEDLNEGYAISIWETWRRSKATSKANWRRS